MMFDWQEEVRKAYAQGVREVWVLTQVDTLDRPKYLSVRTGEKLQAIHLPPELGEEDVEAFLSSLGIASVRGISHS